MRVKGVPFNAFIIEFTPVLYFSFNFCIIMSLQNEVKDLIEEAGGTGVSALLVETVGLAKQEVNKILQVTGGSLLEICKEMEVATTRTAMKAAFGRFNETLGIFLKLDLGPTGDRLLREAVCALKVSEQLESIIKHAPSLSKGCEEYKASGVFDASCYRIGTLRRRMICCFPDCCLSRLHLPLHSWRLHKLRSPVRHLIPG